MKGLKLFAIALLGCFAVACTEELVDSVQMKSSEMSFTTEGGETSLTFDANAAWNITTDAEWITFDADKGVAGEAVVKMTVAANEGYDARQADVTIAVGTSTNVITVKQEGMSEFTAKIPYTLDATAQSITFEIKSNVEYSYKIAEEAKDWITVPAGVKSEPVESTLTFDIAQNQDLMTRVGNIYVCAGDAEYCLVVNQEGVAILDKAGAIYLGNTMDIYNGGYTDIKEYYVTLGSEKYEVNLALNADPELVDDPYAGIPAGTYVIDAGGEHAKSTFSIKPLDNSEAYFTSFKNGETEVEVVDGEIKITKDADQYTINAVLYDMEGRPNNFRYVGAIAEIGDKSYGANVYESLYKGQYDTYFASKANAWVLSVHTNKPLKEDEPHMSYMNAVLYGPAGDVAKDVFPTGTFKFAEPATKEGKYANGNLDAQPGTFTMYACDPEGNDCIVTDGTIVITKEANGKYTIAYELKAVHTVVVYDADWNEVSRTETPVEFAYTFTEMPIVAEIGDFTQPAPDVDHEFKTIMGNAYTGLWLGDNMFGVENSTSMVFGATVVDSQYAFQTCITMSTDEWKFEKNFRGRYCNTPLPNHVYTFTTTPAVNTCYNVLFGAAPYTYIKNNYTGTTLYISEGSIEVTATSLKFNVKATDGTTTCKFTGEVPATLQLAQDWSKRGPSFKLPEVK